MSADPSAAELARDTRRSYTDARLALRFMENKLGYSTHDAQAYLLGVASLDRRPLVVHAEEALAGGDH